MVVLIAFAALSARFQIVNPTGPTTKVASLSETLRTIVVYTPGGTSSDISASRAPLLGKHRGALARRSPSAASNASYEADAPTPWVTSRLCAFGTMGSLPSEG